MRVVTSIVEMQAESDRIRADGRRLALVPTMGSLHEGHLELVRSARRLADHVTVTIFVNPTQFGPGEDFERYPRDLGADLALLSGDAAADLVFAPTVSEMYPEPPLTWVDVERLPDRLCGARRPGHFRGVATVVAKLLSACRPHVAVFGLKDAQQFFVLRRMARDLNLGVELVGVDTVREPDGLALSSRNRYLAPEERTQAVVLSKAVFEARDRILAGETDVAGLERGMRDRIVSASLARIDYAEIVEAETLQPVTTVEPGTTVLAAVAAWFGTARLIDNRIVRAPG